MTERIATFETRGHAWAFMEACEAADVMVGYPSLDGRNAVRYVEPSHCATPSKVGVVTDLPHYLLDETDASPPLRVEARRQGWQPRMAPGQTPYKVGELLALRRLVSDAADLQDMLTPDELHELEREALQ